MPPELNKLLIDIQTALLEIQEFIAGMDLNSYRADSKCKAAVERKFEIIGEACTRMRYRFPETFEKIANGHHIIGFRNRLIYGYDSVDDGIVGMFSLAKAFELLSDPYLESRARRANSLGWRVAPCSGCAATPW